MQRFSFYRLSWLNNPWRTFQSLDQSFFFFFFVAVLLSLDISTDSFTMRLKNSEDFTLDGITAVLLCLFPNLSPFKNSLKIVMFSFFSVSPQFHIIAYFFLIMNVRCVDFYIAY